MAKTEKTTGAAPVTTAAPALVEFKDKAYKSRVIVLTDGRSFPVEKSVIKTADPALVAYLKQHPDFVQTSA